MRTQDISGKRFGRLVVIRYLDKPAYVFECLCDCGVLTIARAGHLKSGKKKSCGCLDRDTRAGRSVGAWNKFPEYRVWRGIKARCYSPSSQNYKFYGGRGIRMSEEWHKDFSAFLRDVGARPGPEYSIDRIRPNEHYEAGNCRWALTQDDNRNKRSNVPLTFQGKTQLCIDWSKELGIPKPTICWRLKQGWPIERVLSR